MKEGETVPVNSVVALIGEAGGATAPRRPGTRPRGKAVACAPPVGATVPSADARRTPRTRRRATGRRALGGARRTCGASLAHWRTPHRRTAAQLAHPPRLA